MDSNERNLLRNAGAPAAWEVSDEEVQRAIVTCPEHQSANYVVDLADTTDYGTSIMVGSGSNLTIGSVLDMLQANTYTNVFVAGGVAGGSGPIEIRVQTSTSTASGSFTDPTSGLAAFPVNIVSGGILWANSGLWGSGNYSLSAPVNNAPLFCSGGVFFGAFQAPGRYVRLILNSGAYPGAITAGIIKQKRVTGSGGGFSYSPGSGSVNV